MQGFLLFLFLLVSASSSDPCENATVLYDDGSRSIHCSEYFKESQDRFIYEGWRRVTLIKDLGGKNLTMPTDYVENGFCGSHSGVWLNGTHPSIEDGIVNRTGCLSTFLSKCTTEYPIQIKNCSSFMVYNLKRTLGSDERYCFGNSPGCRFSISTISSEPRTNLITDINDAHTTLTDLRTVATHDRTTEATKVSERVESTAETTTLITSTKEQPTKETTKTNSPTAPVTTEMTTEITRPTITTGKTEDLSKALLALQNDHFNGNKEVEIGMRSDASIHYDEEQQQAISDADVDLVEVSIGLSVTVILLIILIIGVLIYLYVKFGFRKRRAAYLYNDDKKASQA